MAPTLGITRFHQIIQSRTRKISVILICSVNFVTKFKNKKGLKPAKCDFDLKNLVSLCLCCHKQYHLKV